MQEPMRQIREEFKSLGMAIVTGDAAEALKLMRQINAILGFTEKNEDFHSSDEPSGGCEA